MENKPQRVEAPFCELDVWISCRPFGKTCVQILGARIDVDQVVVLGCIDGPENVTLGRKISFF